MNKVFLSLIASSFLISCGGNIESVQVPDNFHSKTIISNQNSLQKILTKEMVAKVVDIPAEKIMVHIENNIHQPGQYTLLYSWATGKKKSVADGKFEIDEYNSFSIGFINTMSASEFEKYYGSNEGLQIQIDDMTKQENFNKEIGMVEAKYISDYAGKRKTEKLNNVATMAFWETPMNALHILAKDAVFTITANFGKNENTAKSKSVELVKAILNN